jgi:putative addiction module CopG family antidote
VNVNLTPQLEEMIRQKVASGLYTSASEVVREALRLMDEQDRLRAVKLEQLREAIHDGLNSGEPTPWDPAEIKREGRKRRAARTTGGQEAWMPVIVKLPRAKSDLVEIWNYIADDSEARADAFIETVDQKFNALAELPNMGRLRDELADGLYSFPVGRYVLFYRPIPAGIEIVRVLHSARDLDAIFHKDDWISDQPPIRSSSKEFGG